MSSEFNIYNYLRERQNQGSWLTVEIGPRSRPMLDNQTDFYTNNRCYIGVEANLRDISGFAEKKVTQMLANAAIDGQNCFWIDLDSGSNICYEAESGNDSYIENPDDFRCQSILPSGVADEVCVANVLSDPMINRSPNPLKQTIKEIARLLKPNGVVIRRETMTPHQKKSEIQTKLAEFGLREVCYVDLGSSPQTFRQIDLKYGQNIEKSHINPSSHSFYQVLLKQTKTSV